MGLSDQLHAALKSSIEIDLFLENLAAEHAAEIEPLQQESLLQTSAQRCAEIRWTIQTANARFERLRLAGQAEKQRLETEIEGLERLERASQSNESHHIQGIFPVEED